LDIKRRPLCFTRVRDHEEELGDLLAS